MKLLEHEIVDVEQLSNGELCAMVDGKETEERETLLAKARLVNIKSLPPNLVRGLIYLGGGPAAVALAQAEADGSALANLEEKAVDAARRLLLAPAVKSKKMYKPPSTSVTYKAVLHNEKLGIGLALSKGRRQGLAVTITRVDDEVAAITPIRVGDILLSIGDFPLVNVTDEISFTTLVVQRLKKAPRPITLGFAVSDGRVLNNATLPPPPAAATRTTSRSDDELRASFDKKELTNTTDTNKVSTEIKEHKQSETLRICVLTGEGLVAKDRNFLGKKTASDPYCVVYVCGQRLGRTKYCTQTLSPVWNDFFEAAVDMNTPVEVCIKIFDHDATSNDDPMGQVVLDARDECILNVPHVKEETCKSYDVAPTKDCKNATGKLTVALFLRQTPPPMPTSSRDLDARWALRVHAARGLGKDIDAFCVVERDQEGGIGVDKYGVFAEIGRTPVQRKTSQPKWTPPHECEFDAAFEKTSGDCKTDHHTETNNENGDKPKIPQLRDKFKYLGRSAFQAVKSHRSTSSVIVSAAEPGPHARIKLYDYGSFMSAHGAIGQCAFSLQNLIDDDLRVSEAEDQDNLWTEPVWLPLVNLDGRHRKQLDKAEIQVSVALLAAKGRPLSVTCLSMNCGNAPIEPLAALLPQQAKLEELRGTSADVVAIGLQESTTSKLGRGGPRVTAIMQESEDASYDDNSQSSSSNKAATASLKKSLQQELLPGHELVCDASRGQMRLFVFVRNQLAGGCTERRVAYENTGLGHVVSNKGGIAFAMCLAGASQTSLAFFSAHLAAHEGYLFRQRRNSDVREIFSGCRTELASKSSTALRSPITSAVDLTSQIDFCFFVGDLNYRVISCNGEEDTEIDEATINAVDEDDDEEDEDDVESNGENSAALSTIEFARDELSLEMAENRVFCGGWVAPIPPFPPTFKVIRGHQRCVYNKKRIPSWCDRVLYRVRENTSSSLVSRAALLDFNYIPQIKSSDHKPIRALFQLYQPPVRPLVQHETWQITDVHIITVTDILNIAEEDEDEESSADKKSASNKSTTPIKRKQSKAPQPPQLLLRLVTTPREMLKCEALSSRAPQSLNAKWKDCLTCHIFTEQGTFASRGSLHLVACDARKSKEKYLGSATLSVAKVRSFTSRDHPFNFVSVPLVRDDLFVGAISGTIQKVAASH